MKRVGLQHMKPPPLLLIKANADVMGDSTQFDVLPHNDSPPNNCTSREKYQFECRELHMVGQMAALQTKTLISLRKSHKKIETHQKKRVRRRIMVLVFNGAVIVAAAVIVLACAVMPAASTIIVANSIVGRLSEPTQTCTVDFPTVEGAPLAVLDSQLEGQQLTIVTELLVIQVEEFSASRKLTTGGRRSGKRGVISVLDSTTDEPLAAFEYVIDRDEALGSVAEGNALVYTSSPPTPGASKSKANPVIGSVQFTVEGSSSDTMTYTMKFAMEEDHHSGVFPIDAVLVMTSTDAGQRARLEDGAKAASSIFGRWVSPMVLFGGLYGLLYAFSWWKAKVSVAAASATSSGDAAGAKKAKKE